MYHPMHLASHSPECPHLQLALSQDKKCTDHPAKGYAKHLAPKNDRCVSAPLSMAAPTDTGS